MKCFSTAFLCYFITLFLSLSISTCHSWILAFVTSSMKSYFNIIVTFLHSLFLHCLIISKWVFVFDFYLMIRCIFLPFFSFLHWQTEEYMPILLPLTSIVFIFFILYVLGSRKWTVYFMSCVVLRTVRSHSATRLCRTVKMLMSKSIFNASTNFFTVSLLHKALIFTGTSVWLYPCT